MIKIEFVPNDLWVGVYWNDKKIYLCFIPCFPIVIDRIPNEKQQLQNDNPFSSSELEATLPDNAILYEIDDFLNYCEDSSSYFLEKLEVYFVSENRPFNKRFKLKSPAWIKQEIKLFKKEQSGKFTHVVVLYTN